MKKVTGNEKNTMVVMVIVFIIVTGIILYIASLTSSATSGIEFYNYGIKTANVDYITKDNKCLVNVNSLHDKIAGIKVKKSWNLISMTRGKRFIMISKKSSCIYVYGNENGVYMDFAPQKVSGSYYIQLSKICEALEIPFKHSKNKIEIGEGGY